MPSLKKCGCGRVYETMKQWLALPSMGRQFGVQGHSLDLRQCACRSTIALSWELVSEAQDAMASGVYCAADHIPLEDEALDDTAEDNWMAMNDLRKVAG